MKKNSIFVSLLVIGLWIPLHLYGQKEVIEKTLDRKEAISHLRFLASDELMGRDAMRPEIDVAALYIAEQFRKHGTGEFEGLEGYFQTIPFMATTIPAYGELQLGDSTLVHGEEILVLDGSEVSGNYPLVMAGYGMEEDLKGLDLKGKILVVRVGAPGVLDPAKIFELGREKQTLAHSSGAVALIELYNFPSIPWTSIVNYLNKPQLAIDNDRSGETTIPYIWVNDISNEIFAGISQEKIKQARVKYKGTVNRKITGKNVVGFIEGSDPEMKNEYLMLAA